MARLASSSWAAGIGVDRHIVRTHPGAVGTAPQRDPVARCTRRGRAQSSATLLRRMVTDDRKGLGAIKNRSAQA